MGGEESDPVGTDVLRGADTTLSDEASECVVFARMFLTWCVLSTALEQVTTNFVSSNNTQSLAQSLWVRSPGMASQGPVLTLPQGFSSTGQWPVLCGDRGPLPSSCGC